MCFAGQGGRGTDDLNAKKKNSTTSGSYEKRKGIEKRNWPACYGKSAHGSKLQSQQRGTVWGKTSLK